MKHSLMVIGAGILWGSISLFIRVLEGLGLGPMQCVAVRCTLAALICAGIIFCRDPSLLRIRLRHLPFFLGTGIASVVFFNWCYFRCLEIAEGSAIPALLLYTAPVFVTLLSAVLFGERLTLWKMLCLLIVMAGLVLVTGIFGSGEKLSASALLTGLGAGFGYAMYSLFGKYVTEKYGSLTITAWTFLVAAALAVPLSGIGSKVTLLLCPEGILAALGLAVCCTVAPFLLYTSGLRRLEAGKASVLACAEPLAAAVVGALAFGEKFPPLKLAGIALVLVAIIILDLPAKTGRQKEKHP